jgi:hypothetical protein
MQDHIQRALSTPPQQSKTKLYRSRRLPLNGLVGLVLLAIAPVSFLTAPALLLRINEPITNTELERLSNAGQAYGGLSALLSGVATVAVAAALLLQVRQIRMSQAQGVRMIQIELMGMLIHNPELRPVSPTLGDVDRGQRLRDIYTNLMLRYLEMGYEIGYFPAQNIRAELLSQFAVEDIRRFWARTRPLQLTSINNKAQRRFAEIVDEAYGAAVAAGPATNVTPAIQIPQPPPTPVPVSADNRRRLHDIAVGMLLAVAVRRFLQARR